MAASGFGVKVRVEADQTGKKEFNAQIKNLVDSIDISEKLTISPEKCKSLSASIEKGISENKIKIKSIDCSQAVAKLKSDIQNIINSLSIKNGMTISLNTTGSIGNVSTNIKDMGAAAQDGEAKLAAYNAQLSTLKSLESSLKSNYDSAFKGKNQIVDPEQVKKVTQEYQFLLQKINELCRSTNKTIDAGAVNDITERSAALRALILSYLEQAEAAKNASEAGKTSSKSARTEEEKRIAVIERIKSAYLNVQQILNNSSAAKKGVSAGAYAGLELKQAELLALMNDKSLSSDQLAQRLAKINGEVKAYNGEMKLANENTKSFWGRMSNLANKFGAWLSVTQIIMYAVRAVRSMINTVKELDSALTQISIVTGATGKELEKFANQAVKVAKSVGSSTKQIIASAETYARLGYSLQDSLILSDITNQYSNVAATTIDDATSSLTSIMKGYNYTATEMESVVDKLVKVGQEYAVSASELGVALQSGGATLEAGGNTLEESIALIAAGNAAVQDASKVGNALKTTSMRIRSATAELEDMGETVDDVVRSTASYRQEILALSGVDIMLDDENYKSTYQILLEIAKVWDSMTDIQQATLLEDLAGKRNATVVKSIITNIKDLEGAYYAASNAVGTLAGANETRMKSIEATLGKVKASFQELSSEVFSNRLINGAAMVVNVLVNILTWLDRLVGIFPILITLFASISTYKKIMSVNSVANTVVRENKSILEQKTLSDALATSIMNLNTRQQELLKTKLAMLVADEKINAETQEYILNSMAASSASTSGLKASGGVSGIWAGMGALGKIGIIVSIIATVISLISTLVGRIKTAEEKTAELNNKWQELQSTIQGTVNEFKSLKDSANEIIPRFAELAKGVDDYGNNVSLTNEEYEEFWELNNRLAEMFPDINVGMDSNGNSMLALSYSADTLTESLNNLVEAERNAKNVELSKTMPDVLSGIIETRQINNDKIRGAEKYLESLESFYNRVLSGTTLTDADLSYYYQEMDDLGVEYREKSIKTPDGEVTLSGEYELVYDSDDLERSYNNAVAGINAQINSLNNENKNVWNRLNPVVTAWLETDLSYNELSDTMQSLVSEMAASIDYSELGLTSEGQIKDYIAQNIIEPIQYAKPEVQNAMLGLLSLQEMYNKEDVSAGAYMKTIDTMLSELESTYGVDTETIEVLKLTVGYEDVNKQIEEVKKLMLVNANKDTAIAQLSASDLQMAYTYRFEAAANSMSVEEFLEWVERIKLEHSAMVNLFDFSDMFSGFTDVTKGFDSIIDAMSKLREGTALSKQELFELAQQYPELLKQANLFTDGSIAGQQNMLKSILKLKEDEYDAVITKEIEELEAKKAILQTALELEKSKQQALVDLDADAYDGQIDNKEQFEANIKILNTQHGVNYVETQNGVLRVNEEAINDMLENQKSYNENLEGSMNDAAQMIADGHSNGLSGGLESLKQFFPKFKEGLRNGFKAIGTGISTALSKIVSDMMSGDYKTLGKSFGDYFNTAFIDAFSGITDTTVDVSPVEVKWDDDGTWGTIDGKDINDWIDTQQESTTKKIQAIELSIGELDAAIGNLNALKGLDLTSIYGGDPPGSGKDPVEEYIADIEQYREAILRLDRAKKKVSKLEFDIENEEDPSKRIALYEELIGWYEEQQNAQHNLNNLRDTTIEQTIPALEALGFVVSYNADANELYIENLEHLNELQATSVGEYETLDEATNALRKDTEKIIDTLTDLNDENKDGSESWWDLETSIKGAKKSIVDDLKEMAEAANDVVDNLESVYSTLLDAAKEYMSTGYLSADSLQAILDLGPQYLQYLTDEKDRLVINRESLQALIAAKVEDMTVTTALSHVRQILKAIEKGSIDELNALTKVTEANTGSTWDNVFVLLEQARAMAAAKGMSTDFYDGIYESYKKMQSLSVTAVTTIGASMDSLAEGYMSQKDAMNTIFDLTKEMIQWENDQKIENLNDELDSLTEIIDRRKELIQLNKEEDDHNKDVAEKLREIAKLQARIDTLKLDDSREAAAERAKLEEEMYDLQKDLTDTQSDYAVDVQLDALDKQLEDYEKFNEDKIRELEESLDSEEELYQATIARLSGDWDLLYQDLLSWNANYGSTLQTTLVGAWDQATLAVERYGGAVNAYTGVNNGSDVVSGAVVPGAVSHSTLQNQVDSSLKAMRDNSLAWFTATTQSERKNIEANQLELEKIYESYALTDIKKGKDNVWYFDDGTAAYTLDKQEVAKAIVNKMKANSAAWNSTDDSGKRASYENANEFLAQTLGSYLGKPVQKKNGVWYLGDQELYKLSTYHTGGIAGDTPTLKQDEVMAILKKGEPVLSEDHEKGLYRIIDFAQMLSEKLGRVIDTSKLGSFFMNKTTMPALAALGATPGHSEQSYSFNPVVNVNISHNGTMTDADARRYGSIAADSVLQELKDTFTRRGITRIGNAILK